MTFDPVVHPLEHISMLNESNATLWQVATGQPLPLARVPFWVDVRDLAQAHVEALLRPGAGGKRYMITAPEKFSYKLAADIIGSRFDWAQNRIDASEPRQKIDNSHDLDGEIASRELGLSYKSFETSVVDLITQLATVEGCQAAQTL